MHPIASSFRTGRDAERLDARNRTERGADYLGQRVVGGCDRSVDVLFVALLATFSYSEKIQCSFQAISKLLFQLVRQVPDDLLDAILSDREKIVAGNEGWKAQPRRSSIGCVRIIE